MNLRSLCLPPGWYPRDPSKIREFLETKAEALQKTAGLKPPCRITAAVSPHAGWFYSGALSVMAVASLAAGGAPNTVAVIGGHLPKDMPALFALEDAADTPLGPLEIDAELREALVKNFQAGVKAAEDRYQDNTVEVLLPMVKHFFPEARLLWVRFPADIRSFDAGKILARTAAALGRSLLVLGSTDLTHYGANYGFSPNGYGRKALEWVKNVNDKRFIDAVEAGDPGLALERAEGERSACSAGAVLGVMGFAEEMRVVEKQSAASGSAGKLLSYGTSADVSMDDEGSLPDSFVGYGAFAWEN
jgi:AmmeMemoRadiSam system protein B